MADVDKSRHIYMEEYDGEIIKGRFYAQELNKIHNDNDHPYKYEKVINTRKRGKKKEH